jgi:catechol 2,3-dioxygenase-like lactoylglutathione lyase family enzyme
MSLLTGGLHHLTIRTTDLARAKRFYIETMGFQAVIRFALASTTSRLQ